MSHLDINDDDTIFFFLRTLPTTIGSDYQHLISIASSTEDRKGLRMYRVDSDVSDTLYNYLASGDSGSISDAYNYVTKTLCLSIPMCRLYSVLLDNLSNVGCDLDYDTLADNNDEFAWYEYPQLLISDNSYEHAANVTVATF